MSNEDILKMNNGKKFDIVLMNPPFNRDFHVKFFKKACKLINEKTGKLITIQPANEFYTDIKRRKDIHKFIDDNNIKLQEVDIDEEFKKNFNVGSSILAITYINQENQTNKIIFNKGNEKIVVNDKKDIHLGSKVLDLQDNKYLNKFGDKVKEYFENHKSLYDVCVTNPKNNHYFDPTGKAKLVEKWNNKNTYFVILAYCVALFITKVKLEQYSDDLWYGPAKTLIPFDNKNEAENCFNTICHYNGTKCILNDYFRMLITYIEVKNDIKNSHKYHYMPWLDFSKTYTTEELFNIIGMEYNKKEIDKILND